MPFTDANKPELHKLSSCHSVNNPPQLQKAISNRSTVPIRKYSPFSDSYEALCEEDVKLYNLNPVLSTCQPDL